MLSDTRSLIVRHGLDVRFRPMAVRRVFDETGGLPLPKRHPVRQRYRLVELQRWREKRGLPLNLQPKFAGMDTTLADRSVIALIANGRDPDAFVRLAGATQWANELDLSAPDVLADLLAKSGTPDPAAILAGAASTTTAAELEANYDAALSAGVFGVPSFVLDGEVFWGQDRLELLYDALKSGRAPFRPMIS